MAILGSRDSSWSDWQAVRHIPLPPGKDLVGRFVELDEGGMPPRDDRRADVDLLLFAVEHRPHRSRQPADRSAEMLRRLINDELREHRVLGLGQSGGRDDFVDRRGELPLDAGSTQQLASVLLDRGQVRAGT